MYNMVVNMATPAYLFFFVFSIDIFMHKDSDMDIRNCFWASAQTKKAQDYIIQLAKDDNSN